MQPGHLPRGLAEGLSEAGLTHSTGRSQRVGGVGEREACAAVKVRKPDCPPAHAGPWATRFTTMSLWVATVLMERLSDLKQTKA